MGARAVVCGGGWRAGKPATLSSSVVGVRSNACRGDAFGGERLMGVCHHRADKDEEGTAAHRHFYEAPETASEHTAPRPLFCQPAHRRVSPQVLRASMLASCVALHGSLRITRNVEMIHESLPCGPDMGTYTGLSDRLASGIDRGHFDKEICGLKGSSKGQRPNGMRAAEKRPQERHETSIPSMHNKHVY